MEALNIDRQRAELDPANVVAQDDVAVSLFKLASDGDATDSREQRRGWMEEAVSIYERLLALDPKNERSENNLNVFRATLESIDKE